jgi:hypothetical protein
MNGVSNIERVHMRQVHLGRLKKIKNRLPGTGGIDNVPVEAAESMRSASRKLVMRRIESVTIEQENKALLQRIGKILTAPPKISDEDYQKMKLLCPSMRGPRQIYEEKVAAKHHAKQIKYLKSLTAYYKPSQWEKEYKLQLRHQFKFMRRCPYKRPKGFFDPYAKVEEPESLSSKSLAKKQSAAHINRIKEISVGESGKHNKSTINTKNPVLSKHGSKTNVNDSLQKEHRGFGEDFDNSHKLDGLGQNSHLTSSSLLEQSSEFLYEKKLELAVLNREVRVEYDGPYNDAKGPHPIGASYYAFNLKCWLVDESSLVISAITEDAMEAGGVIDTEAEIEVEDLAYFKGISEHNIARDIGLLEGLASEMINTVEVKVENGVARLVLILSDGEDDPEKNIDYNYNDTSLAATEDEISNLLLDENVDKITFTRGICVSLRCSQHIPSPSVATRQAAKNLTKEQQDIAEKTEALKRAKMPKIGSILEKIFVIAKVHSNINDEENAVVTLHFNSDSKTKFNNKTIILANTSLQTSTGIPSIMQADPGLIKEFFTNLTDSLCLEHCIITGKVLLNLIDQ